MSKISKGYQSTLWEISRKRSPNKWYLFGTIHMGHEMVMSRMAELESIIKQVDFLAVEHHLDHARTSILAQMQMDEDLSVLIGRKKFDKASKIVLKSFNIDLRLFETVYPIQTLNFLSLVSISAQQSTPLDMQLWQIAKGQNKRCFGLESLDRTKEIFDQLDIGFQVDQLLKAISNIPKFRKKVSQMLDMYQQEKIDKIYKSGKASLGKHRKLLLFERNQQMVDASISLMKEGSGVFAVGAAHLWGMKGMINYFKRLGFTLKAI